MTDGIQEGVTATATATAKTEALYHEEYTPPFLPLLVLLPFLLPVFWTYSVDVSKESLSFGYSWNVSRKSVALSQVATATVIPEIHGLREWGGWGIRYNLAMETGYIAKNGPGVRITLNNEIHKQVVYVFNCNDPELVCSLVNSSKG